MKSRPALLVPLTLLFVGQAGAADAPPTFVRGVVKAIDNDSVTLRLASGKPRRLALAPDCRVSVLKAIDVSRI